MNSVRWGLLSTANINRRLIPAIRESTRGELVAVSSRSLDKAEQYAQQWKIPRAFGSYQDMLTSGEVDAVYISLPNYLHAEWSIKALKAGVHVLCEKPFAMTLEDVDAMIDASRQSGCVLAEGLMYRCHPQTELVGEWIRDGTLGDISLIRGGFNFRLPDHQRQPDSLNVRMVAEYGGGCLWDVGIYPLSYTQFLLGGPPEWVFGSQLIGKTGIDEVFSGQMGYSLEGGNQVLAQISSSFKTPYHTFMEITGSEGTFYIPRPFNEINQREPPVFKDKKGRTRKIRVQKKSLYLGEVEDLQSAILDCKQPLVSLEETRNHIKTALALYKSAQTDQVVNLKKSR